MGGHKDHAIWYINEYKNLIYEEVINAYVRTAALSEARTTLPERNSRPLPAKMAHSRNLAHASLEIPVVT